MITNGIMSGVKMKIKSKVISADNNVVLENRFNEFLNTINIDDIINISQSSTSTFTHIVVVYIDR